MSRPERRALSRALDFGGKMPFEVSIKLYLLSRQVVERPRVRAYHTVIVLHCDTTSPQKENASALEQQEAMLEHWEAFANSFFDETPAQRLYVVDYTRARDQFLSEISTHAASKLSKPIIRILTKLNVFDATILAFEHTSCVAVKLLSCSGILCQRVERLLLVQPTNPKRQTWYRAGTEIPTTQVHFFAEPEKKAEYVWAQDFVRSLFPADHVFSHRVVPGHQVKVQVLEWLGEKFTDFDCELTCTQPFEYDYDDDDDEEEEEDHEDGEDGDEGGEDEGGEDEGGEDASDGDASDGDASDGDGGDGESSEGEEGGACTVYEIMFMLDRNSKQTEQRFLEHYDESDFEEEEEEEEEK